MSSVDTIALQQPKAKLSLEETITAANMLGGVTLGAAARLQQYDPSEKGMLLGFGIPFASGVFIGAGHMFAPGDDEIAAGMWLAGNALVLGAITYADSTVGAPALATYASLALLLMQSESKVKSAKNLLLAAGGAIATYAASGAFENVYRSF